MTQRFGARLHKMVVAGVVMLTVGCNAAETQGSVSELLETAIEEWSSNLDELSPKEQDMLAQALYLQHAISRSPESLARLRGTLRKVIENQYDPMMAFRSRAIALAIQFDVLAGDEFRTVSHMWGMNMLAQVAHAEWCGRNGMLEQAKATLAELTSNQRQFERQFLDTYDDKAMKELWNYLTDRNPEAMQLAPAMLAAFRRSGMITYLYVCDLSHGVDRVYRHGYGSLDEERVQLLHIKLRLADSLLLQSTFLDVSLQGIWRVEQVRHELRNLAMQQIAGRAAIKEFLEQWPTYEYNIDIIKQVYLALIELGEETVEFSHKALLEGEFSALGFDRFPVNVAF